MAKTSFCEIVEANCEAPPGFRTGLGAVYRGDKKVSTRCTRCRKFVCTKCSKMMSVNTPSPEEQQERRCMECIAEEKS